MQAPIVRHHAPPGFRRRKMPTRRAIADARLTTLRADYRDALTLLAATVRLVGGEVRLAEEDFATLDPQTRIETTADEETRDLIIRVHEPKPEAPPCPTCGAEDGVPCTSKSGRKLAKSHKNRATLPAPVNDDTDDGLEDEAHRAKGESE